MATLNIQILTNKPYTEFAKADQRPENLYKLINLLSGMASGALDQGNVYVSGSTVSPVAASGTITLASCATDTVTVGKTTFTGTGSPTTSLHFETDGDDTADAAALAAAINAHTDTSKIVYATSSGAVVTVTAHDKGLLGNHIALAETGSTITVSGAYLSGGTGGASAAPVTIK